MSLLRLAVFSCLIGGYAASAWAQYGLYGSPESLRLPQANSAGSYEPSGYPGIAVPVTQTVSASQPTDSSYHSPQQPMQPQWQQPTQTPHPYPAQVSAVAMNQSPQPQYSQYPQPQYPQPQPTAQQYQQYSQPQPVMAPSQPVAQQYAPYSPYQPTVWQYPTYAQSQPASQQYAKPSPYQPAGPQYQPPRQYPMQQQRVASSYSRSGVQATAMYQSAGQAAPQPMPTPADMSMPQEPNLTGQMLAEPGAYGNCGDGCDPNANGALRGDACSTSPDCIGGYCPWYASLSTLVLGRSEGRRLWTSYADQHNVDQLTNTQDIRMPWSWGGEIKLGRRFGCGCDTWAMEGTFWTTGPMDGYRSTINNTISPYAVSTPLQVSDLQFGGVIAPNWFDGAEEHRLWRHDEFYNVELNLVRMQMFCGCDSPWDIGWGVGLRYFRFRENLTFGSLRDGGVWSDPTAQAYLNDTITNNMLGAQIGFDLAYRFCESARFFISPKAGIFNNSMDQNFRAYLGDGTVGTTPYGPFPVRANRNGIAFLTQVDLGVDWQFSRNWSARFGYRVVAINGAALADDQFPQYIVDLPEIAHIDNHSSLILHGAFAGVTYNF